MKKVFFSAALFVCAALISAPLASCSSDDKNDNPVVDVTDPANYPSAAPQSLQAVVQTYVNDVVYPTYASLAKNAQQLKTACDALYAAAEKGSMTQAQIDAACSAFKAARVEWEQSEAFLYGAAEDKDIDPHIDSWPLDQSQVKDVLTNSQMVNMLKGADAVSYVREKNADFDTALGFHGMEFVLFRDGKNRTVAALNTNETAEGMTSVKGIDEIAFLKAVAGDLRDKCYQLEFCWSGNASQAGSQNWFATNASDIETSDLFSAKGNSYGENMFATGNTGKSNWETWQENANNILVGGCSGICQEVYTQKLGQAYRVATKAGGDEDAGDYIESPYSKNSFTDYQGNIYSIKNTLYGTRNTSTSAPVQNSLLNYLKKNGYERTANLSAALNDAIKALETAKNSGIAFVDQPGHAQVGEAISKIQTLDNELNKAGQWIARN